jgi:PcfJ-like protein
MLAARFGFPETEHAVHVLRKVPTPWITPEFLAQLRLVMTEEPDVEAVINHLKHINPLALEVLRDPEMHASLAPDCIKHLCRVSAPASQCDLIGRLRDLEEYARHHGLPLPRIRKLSDLDRPAPRVEFPQPQLTDPVPLGNIAPLPAATVPHPGLEDRTPPVQSRRKSQRPDRYLFPEPPLPDLVAPGIRIEAIRSQQELIAESKAMHHCAGRDPSYARRVSAGSLYFYRMIEPERLTIALRCKHKYWAIDQLGGVCNRMATTDCAGPIWNWVQSSWASSAAAERVNSAVILRQLRTPVRRRLHSTDQLSFSFEQSE